MDAGGFEWFGETGALQPSGFFETGEATHSRHSWPLICPKKLGAIHIIQSVMAKADCARQSAPLTGTTE